MASGSTITASGMQTMTQVVAGTDLILPADYNNARTNVDRLLGTAQDVSLGTFTAGNTYGYGQGGATTDAQSTGDLVYANDASNGFKQLQDDVQSLAAFLGVTLSSGVGTDVTSSNTITAALWNNLMTDIQTIWNTRFVPDAASITTTTEDTVTYTSAWSTSLSQETTFTFANEAACRAFFNAGGKLGVSSTRSGGSSTTQNTNWSNLLTATGDVFMSYNDTTASSGTSTNVGFYELSTSYAELLTKFGSGSYATNYFRLEGKVNSVTNPTVVTLRTSWNDIHAEGSGDGPDGIPGTGDDGYGNDTVNGTLSLNIRVQQPTGGSSGISVSKPTDNAGTISGS